MSFRVDFPVFGRGQTRRNAVPLSISCVLPGFPLCAATGSFSGKWLIFLLFEMAKRREFFGKKKTELFGRLNPAKKDGFATRRVVFGGQCNGVRLGLAPLAESCKFRNSVGPGRKWAHF